MITIAQLKSFRTDSVYKLDMFDYLIRDKVIGVCQVNSILIDQWNTMVILKTSGYRNELVEVPDPAGKTRDATRKFLMPTEVTDFYERSLGSGRLYKSNGMPEKVVDVSEYQSASMLRDFASLLLDEVKESRALFVLRKLIPDLDPDIKLRRIWSGGYELVYKNVTAHISSPILMLLSAQSVAPI